MILFNKYKIIKIAEESIKFDIKKEDILLYLLLLLFLIIYRNLELFKRVYVGNIEYINV